MFHLITDNITAYRRAVVSTENAQNSFIYGHGDGDDLNNCREEERIRYDGLVSIIVMEIKAAAADDPHNPFSISGDVNQPDETPITPGPPPRREE